MSIVYEHSEDCKVCKYQKGVEEVLKALNHVEAYVTDESIVHDFLEHHMDEEQRSQWLSSLSDRIGFKVKFSSYIWEIAQKLEKKANNNDQT